MTDKLDASVIEPTPLLDAVPDDGIFLMRMSPTGDFAGLPKALLPSGSGGEQPGPITILDGGMIGQGADRIVDHGLVGDTADEVFDGGLVGETGAGITAQQLLRGDPTAWASPTARLRQGQPGVVFDAATGAVLGVRIGKGVTSDPLATTALADNPMLLFYPPADRDKLADIEPDATAAGAVGDAHAAVTGNPHGTGMGDVVGLTDAISARAPAVHTHSPDQVGLGNVENALQIKAALKTSYSEITAPATGDAFPLWDASAGALGWCDWSRLPSGGGGGSSSNPAITLATTTQELLDAIAADKKIIFIGDGVFNFSTTLVLNGTQLIGAGRGRTTLNWTGGATPAIRSATPTTRTYNSGLRGFTLNDNGSGTIGIAWEAISAGYLENLHVNNFDTGYAFTGANGYCVYNRIYDCTAQGGTTGFLIGGTGSNSNQLLECRGNAIAGWCVDISASNNTVIMGGQFESSTSGIRVRSDSVADGDGTLVLGNRFENINGGSGGIAVQIAGPNTRDAMIIGNYLVSTGGTIDNNGTRTTIISMPYAAGAGPQLNLATPYGTTIPFRLTRTAAAADNVAALSVSDTNTGSGNPTTLAVNTERATGKFLVGLRGGNPLVTLQADGKGLFSGGIGVGNSATASSMGALTHKMEVFDASGASLGFVPIYAS